MIELVGYFLIASFGIFTCLAAFLGSIIFCVWLSERLLK